MWPKGLGSPRPKQRAGAGRGQRVKVYSTVLSIKYGHHFALCNIMELGDALKTDALCSIMKLTEVLTDTLDIC